MTVEKILKTRRSPAQRARLFAACVAVGGLLLVGGIVFIVLIGIGLEAME